MEVDLQMLESYFCKPGEFLKDTETVCINYPIVLTNDTINIQFRLSLITDDLQSNLNVNRNFSLTTTTTQLDVKTFPSREILSDFKILLIHYIEDLANDKNLSLFNVCLWVQQNLQAFVNEKYAHFVVEKNVPGKKACTACDNTNADLFYGSITKLDHIRSRKRYLKFLQATSKNLSLDIELLETSRLIFLKVISQGNEEGIKDFNKTLRTSLVDVDRDGKPCKERMSEVLSATTQLNMKAHSFSISFNQHEFESIDEICNYLKKFGFEILGLKKQL